MLKYNTNEPEDQSQQRDEVDYYAPRTNQVTQIQTLGYCPTCDKRITTGDEVWETESGVYCSAKCEKRFLEMEREGNDQ